jgi:hypothetical protein
MGEITRLPLLVCHPSFEGSLELLRVFEGSRKRQVVRRMPGIENRVGRAKPKPVEGG